MKLILGILGLCFIILGVVGNVRLFLHNLLVVQSQLPSPGLKGVVECWLSACRNTLVTADFPKFPSILFISGVLLCLLVLRPRRPYVYTARFAKKHQLKDLRLKGWLRHPKLPYSLLIGHYVALPEPGQGRNKVLSGHFKADTALLVLSPGYGGRSELGNMALFGMTRSGKSLHLMAQLATWGGSVVVLDIKGELYRKTAGHRSSLSTIYRLSPTGEGHQFDALSAVMASHNGYATAAQIIAAPHLDKEPAFAQRAAAGIEAALRAATIAGAPPLTFIRALIYQGGLQAFVNTISKELRRAYSLNADEARIALNTFLGMTGGQDFSTEHALGDKYLMSSWGSMVQRLKPFIQEGVQHLLGGQDFLPRDLMLKPCSVYLDFPEESLEATSPVYNLIVTGLIRGMSKFVDEVRQGQPPQVRVLFGLDEIARAPLQDLSNILATASSRQISTLLYLQSPSQFDAIYSKDQTEAILNNCATQLYFKSESLATAEYISRRCFRVSVDTRSHSRRPGFFKRPTVNQNTANREVITVDEVMALGGPERQLVIAMISGKPPTLVKRINYYEVPRLNVALMKSFQPEVQAEEPISSVITDQSATVQSEEQTEPTPVSESKAISLRSERLS
jgi:type IV secretion system protein VirD4